MYGLLLLLLIAWSPGHEEISRLGDEDWIVRERASERLETLGWTALPALIRAGQADDPEIRHRARHACQPIQSNLSELWLDVQCAWLLCGPEVDWTTKDVHEDLGLHLRLPSFMNRSAANAEKKEYVTSLWVEDCETDWWQSNAINTLIYMRCQVRDAIPEDMKKVP